MLFRETEGLKGVFWEKGCQSMVLMLVLFGFQEKAAVFFLFFFLGGVESKQRTYVVVFCLFCVSRHPLTSHVQACTVASVFSLRRFGE